MANLYDIDREIMECIDMETGEIIDIEKLDALQMERDRKIDNILCWIKCLRADAKAMEEEEKILKKRREAVENKAESLSAYVSRFLDGKKWSSPRAQASFRRSESTEWTDWDAALAWCKEHAKEAVTEKTTYTLSKTVVKDLIKAGGEVPGAEIVEKNNLQIK